MATTTRKQSPTVTDQLRNAILAGQFMPSERLVEADVAALYNANRANVRIALAVLEKEGLVEREANRGARVRKISDQEAVEIAEARTALEAFVAFRAAERATDADCEGLQSIIADMREAFKLGDFLRFSDLNGDLHKEIQRIAANETIKKLLSAVKSQTVRLQFRAILIPGRPEQSMVEHTAIVDAIVARDPEAAERAMRNHLGGVSKALKQAISMQQIR